MIVWITGPSKAGKTTLAKSLQSKLVNWVLLDGDGIRSITNDLGYSFDDRMENCTRVAKLAKQLSEQGLNIIISVIAPYQKIREEVDKICSPKWVCLPKPLQETEYDNPYEIPTNALMIDINQEEKVIHELKIFSVFVVGSRRSGTSLMVQILEKLGVDMFYDNQNVSIGGEDTGYMPYEIQTHAMTKYYKIAYMPYTGCKILLPFVPVKIDIITDVPCKVIFTWREPKNILESQKNLGMGLPKEILGDLLKNAEEDQAEQFRQLKELNVNILVSHYEKMMEDPTSEIQKIADFIKSDKPIEEAVSLVKV